MKNEFKVGDKVALIATVTEIDYTTNYKILAVVNNENFINFTVDGRYNIYDEEQNVFHLEDLQSKPEFPKWMMVSEKENYDLKKRYVIIKYPNGKYVAVANAINDFELLTSNSSWEWNYAIDIPEESIYSIKKEKLMTEIEALKLQVEKLEIQANKL